MTRSRALLALLAAALWLGSVSAQSGPPNGMRQVDPRWHAFRGATAVVSPGQVVENATVVLRDGVVVSVEAGGAVPEGARVWNGEGLYLYPGLIEPYLPVEVPAHEGDASVDHWNARVAPQRSALDGEGVASGTQEALRKLGFTAAGIAPRSGVFRGRGSVVLLADRGETVGTRHAPVVVRDAFHTVAFDRRGSGYPRSTMGAVAVVRQTLIDAETYAENHAIYRDFPGGNEPPPVNEALAALGASDGSLPLWFEVDDELRALSAIRTAAEASRPVVVVGSGTEYRRLDALAKRKARMIVPVNYAEAPDVSTLADAERVSLREMMAWEQAPTNPRRIVAAGMEAALTTFRLGNVRDFPARLREAIRHGLSERDALAMLTTNPAKLLGVSEQLGELTAGKIANMVVTDGPLFDKDTRILDVWVRGQRHEIHDPSAAALEGRWTTTSDDLAAMAGTMTIASGNKVTIEVGETKLRGRKAAVHESGVDFLLEDESLGQEGAYVLHAIAQGDQLLGSGHAPDGSRFAWAATRAPADESEDDDAAEPEDEPIVPEILPMPFGAYGLLEMPRQPQLLLRNATIWHHGRDMVTRVGNLLVRDGKVQWIGDADIIPNLENMEEIDCTGKHITPGLIDCHSHTGIDGGVNEGTQAVTSEVRIADVLDPDDIDWYRQLAGGVTMVQQLHGSANPIGGQSNLVKLRWGVSDPDEMRVRGGKLGIKFALGENVKRSRSRPGSGPTRYPSSRMGVETLIRDRFTAAKEYSRGWQRYLRLPGAERRKTYKPRRDLELDALAEILSGLRMVHCHSYRQDEILMLCRVAEDFGFKIGTFQHGLECYKVAEAVKEHAIGASVFSDWWAYKFEVFDAIPHNGAILYKLGVITSFNSDSNELARRLNTEAAKAVKYGGLQPREALSFVTRGPAKQLGMDERVGSFALGMEADFVIWSGDPLSPMTRCEATYIDGREYFSLVKDEALRQYAAAERVRLLQKLRAAPKRKKSDSDKKKADDEPKDYEDWEWGDTRGVCGCYEEVVR